MKLELERHSRRANCSVPASKEFQKIENWHVLCCYPCLNFKGGLIALVWECVFKDRYAQKR